MNRDRTSGQPSIEEIAYEQAFLELEEERPRNGLWIKALADSDGDEKRAKAAYLKYRSKQIIKEAKNARLVELKFSALQLVRKTYSGIRPIVIFIFWVVIILCILLILAHIAER